MVNSHLQLIVFLIIKFEEGVLKANLIIAQYGKQRA